MLEDRCGVDATCFLPVIWEYPLQRIRNVSIRPPVHWWVSTLRYGGWYDTTDRPRRQGNHVSGKSNNPIPTCSTTTILGLQLACWMEAGHYWHAPSINTVTRGVVSWFTRREHKYYVIQILGYTCQVINILLDTSFYLFINNKDHWLVDKARLI